MKIKQNKKNKGQESFKTLKSYVALFFLKKLEICDHIFA